MLTQMADMLCAQRINRSDKMEVRYELHGAFDQDAGLHAKEAERRLIASGKKMGMSGCAGCIPARR